MSIRGVPLSSATAHFLELRTAVSRLATAQVSLLVMLEAYLLEDVVMTPTVIC